MTLRFGHIELFTPDPAATARFYVEALGFTLVVQQGPDFSWVACGNVEILLRRGRPGPGGARYAEAGTALVLYTDDVAATVERLRAAGIEMRGDDGPTNPTFTDPDGRWIQLADPG